MQVRKEERERRAPDDDDSFLILDPIHSGRKLRDESTYLSCCPTHHRPPPSSIGNSSSTSFLCLKKSASYRKPRELIPSPVPLTTPPIGRPFMQLGTILSTCSTDLYRVFLTISLARARAISIYLTRLLSVSSHSSYHDFNRRSRWPP